MIGQYILKYWAIITAFNNPGNSDRKLEVVELPQADIRGITKATAKKKEGSCILCEVCMNS
jgi:hypothetical protein